MAAASEVARSRQARVPVFLANLFDVVPGHVVTVQPDPEVAVTQIDPPVVSKIEFVALAALGRRNPRFRIPSRDWAGDAHESFSSNDHESAHVAWQFQYGPPRCKDRNALLFCIRHRFSVAPTMCRRDSDFASECDVYTCRRSPPLLMSDASGIPVVL